MSVVPEGQLRQAQPTKGLFLQGIVVARETGEPIRNARVRTEYVLSWDKALARARTDEEGYFGIPFGHQRTMGMVFAFADGFDPAFVEPALPTRGGPLLRVALELESPPIKGRVVDEAGGPVQGVSVELFDIPSLGGTGRLFAMRGKLVHLGLGWRSMTDENGEFELRRVPGQECTVQVFSQPSDLYLSKPLAIASLAREEAPQEIVLDDSYHGWPVLRLSVREAASGNVIERYKLFVFVGSDFPERHPPWIRAPYAVEATDGWFLLPIVWQDAARLKLEVWPELHDDKTVVFEGAGDPMWTGEKRLEVEVHSSNLIRR